MKRQIDFIRHFLRNPEKVGALTALNESVARTITKYLENHPKGRGVNILEVGAGYGNISKFIVDLMQEKDRFDIVELDSDCCRYLEKEIATRPGVGVHCCSVHEWQPDYRYDYIISTLPFNSFSKEFVERVLDHYQQLSAENAIFSYVEYAALQTLRRSFANKSKKEQMRSRQKLLDDFRKNYLIEKKCVLSNVPPCNVYHLKLRG